MNIVYFTATGSSDPTRASIAFHLAVNGSVEAGQETSVVLGGDATELVLGDVASTLEGLGVPPLRELFSKVKEKFVPVYI